MEKLPVNTVREFLETLGVKCQPSSLQNFLRRVLVELPDSMHQIHAVDARLLRAVRRRLNLPLHPKRKNRISPSRGIPHFYSPGGVTPVRPRRATVSPVSPAARPQQTPRFEITRPKPAESRVLEVPADREPTLLEWRAINKVALAKLPDNVLANWHGQVIDTNTHEAIRVEALVGKYGLALREAQSLFLTL